MKPLDNSAGLLVLGRSLNHKASSYTGYHNTEKSWLDIVIINVILFHYQLLIIPHFQSV